MAEQDQEERDVASEHEKVDRLRENIAKALQGKDTVINLALVALLAEGHLLIEDAPGVGKTSLAKAIARSISCRYARLQCTPDMLPSDILGTSVFGLEAVNLNSALDGLHECSAGR